VKQFWAALESLLTLVLVIIAIAGIAFHSFREGGLISRGFSMITDAYINSPLLALGATVALFFAVRGIRERQAKGARTRIFDYFVYVLMAIGIYFVGHVILTGEL
jgi:hypothetical protein